MAKAATKSKAKAKNVAKPAARVTAPARKNPVKKKAAAKAKGRPAPRLLTVAQRDRVLAAAIRSLEADGYAAFSLARVAARAKLELKLVKSSFPSKLHLLAAALETNLEKESDVAEQMILNEVDFRTSTSAALTKTVLGQLGRPRSGRWQRLYVTMDIAEREPEHADIWRMVEHRIAERGSRIVVEMQRRGYIDDTLDPRWVQFFWNALMDGIAVRARALPKGAGLDLVAEGITPILLRGLAPKRG